MDEQAAIAAIANASTGAKLTIVATVGLFGLSSLAIAISGFHAYWRDPHQGPNPPPMPPRAIYGLLCFVASAVLVPIFWFTSVLEPNDPVIGILTTDGSAEERSAEQQNSATEAINLPGVPRAATQAGANLAYHDLIQAAQGLNFSMPTNNPCELIVSSASTSDSTPLMDVRYHDLGRSEYSRSTLAFRLNLGPDGDLSTHHCGVHVEIDPDLPPQNLESMWNRLKKYCNQARPVGYPVTMNSVPRVCDPE